MYFLCPGSSVLLQRQIAASVARQMSSLWTPPNLKLNSITWRGKPPVSQREVSRMLNALVMDHDATNLEILRRLEIKLQTGII